MVFNNGVHDSVGGQPIGNPHLDFRQVARASGYRMAEQTATLAEIAAKVDRLRQAGGPALLELRVRPGSRTNIGRPTISPQSAKTTFMAELRGQAL